VDLLSLLRRSCQQQKRKNKCENDSNLPKLPSRVKDLRYKANGLFLRLLIQMLLLHHYRPDHLLSILHYLVPLMRVRGIDRLGVGMRVLELLGRAREVVEGSFWLSLLYIHIII
jgi:hypothetical protein